ncbi:hypothetical protein GOODEAATRI_034428, partial [Goodea atripinnis]
YTPGYPGSCSLSCSSRTLKQDTADSVVSLPIVPVSSPTALSTHFEETAPLFTCLSTLRHLTLKDAPTLKALRGNKRSTVSRLHARCWPLSLWKDLPLPSKLTTTPT